jgi:hypothetical protein
MRNATNPVIPGKDQNSEQAALVEGGSNKVMNDSIAYRISAKRVLLWLTIIALTLNIISAVGRGIEYLLGIQETTPLVHLFHVGEEGNLTTWFSAMLFLLSSILLAIIARALHVQGQPYVRHWSILSVVFFYLSLDDAARIHELAVEPLRNLLHASGVLYYTWIILAIPLLVLLFIFYFKFIRDLPRDTRLFFLVAGGIYVFGAVGMDMAAGYVLTHQLPRLLVSVLVTIESLLQYGGIIVFIYALLTHIRSHMLASDIRLRFV